jgi:hypothetical protein
MRGLLVIDASQPILVSHEGHDCPMHMMRRCTLVVCCLWFWLGAGQAWGQNISLFPKEDILLVGGDFRIRQINSNIAIADAAGGGPSGGFPTQNAPTKNFFDTRLRLYWDFRPSALLRVSYRMEIGDIVFGGNVENGSDVSGNIIPSIGPGSGGGVGADGVNVETKDLFIEFEIPPLRGLSFRGGIFPYGDRYDFNILADDFAGLELRYKRGDVAAHFVYLKFLEGDTRTNADDSDWFGIDGELRVSPSTVVASTFYFWSDGNSQGTLDFKPYQWWLGGEITTRLTSGLGPIQINGYVIYNQGEGYFGRRRGKNQGFNLSLAGDLFLRLGTLGLQVQYISGEEGSKRQLETRVDNDPNDPVQAGDGSKASASISSWLGYYNNMYGGPEIISRGPLIDVGDGFNSKWGTGNGFFNGDYNGRLLFIARSAFPLWSPLSLHVVGAYDRAAAANANGDFTRGFEIDVWAQWTILPKLWLRFGGAFYFTGDWWKNNPDASINGRGLGTPGQAGVPDPDNIWQFGVRLQYDFG